MWWLLSYTHTKAARTRHLLQRGNPPPLLLARSHCHSSSFFSFSLAREDEDSMLVRLPIRLFRGSLSLHSLSPSLSLSLSSRPPSLSLPPSRSLPRSLSPSLDLSSKGEPPAKRKSKRFHQRCHIPLTRVYTNTRTRIYTRIRKRRTRARARTRACTRINTHLADVSALSPVHARARALSRALFLVEDSFPFLILGSVP